MVNIDVLFQSGIGQLEAKLFKGGALIDRKKITISSIVSFEEGDSGDVISINGTCTGDTTITIDRATDPATPDHCSEGNFNLGYDIL